MKIFQNFKMNGFKTLLVAVINCVALFVPGLKEWISANPGEYAQLLSIVMIVMRIVTKTPITESTPVLNDPDADVFPGPQVGEGSRKKSLSENSVLHM